jgi:hypothetical protein
MPGPCWHGRPIERAPMGPERRKECDWTRVRNSTGLVPTVLRGNAVPDARRRLAAATWGRPDSRNGVRAGERRANRKTTRSVGDGIPTRSVGTSFRCNAAFRGCPTCLFRTHFSTANQRVFSVFTASEVRDVSAYQASPSRFPPPPRVFSSASIPTSLQPKPLDF